jgi:dihydroflavonol-4-reductase
VRLPMAAPAAMIRVMSSIMYVFDKFIPLPESYTGEGLRVIAGVTYIGNNSKARRELGYYPRPLKEGLAETLKHEMELLHM